MEVERDYYNTVTPFNILWFPGRSRGQIQLANLERDNFERSVNDNSNSSPPPVNFSDIMTVFRRAVKEVRAGQGALAAGELRGGDSGYFNRTIVILLHLVCLLTKLIPHLEKDKVRGWNMQ